MGSLPLATMPRGGVEKAVDGVGGGAGHRRSGPRPPPSPKIWPLLLPSLVCPPAAAGPPCCVLILFFHLSLCACSPTSLLSLSRAWSL